RPLHRGVFPAILSTPGVSLPASQFVSGNQLCNESHVGLIHDDQAPRAIEGHSTPVRAANNSRVDQRAFQAGRRKDPVAPQSGDLLTTLATIPGSQSPSLLRLQMARCKWWRDDRERLCRRKPFAGNTVLRHRAFLRTYTGPRDSPLSRL